MTISQELAPTQPVKRRVLLVDDDPTQLKLNRLLLEQAGYVVRTAQNADEALQQTHAEPPDAVLSDVWMGEVDGFNLCRQLRTNPRFANVPVILLSADCDGPRDRELSLRVGATQLVARSPDFRSELAALETTLHQAAPVACEASGTELYEQMLRRNASQITRLIAQLKAAENRYRMLFEHANDAIALLAPDGAILEANHRWPELLGAGRDQLVGRHFQDFAKAGADRGAFEDFQRVLAAGVGRSVPVPLGRADGSVLMLEFSISTVEIAGEPTVLAIGRDVTLELRAREALATAEARYRSLIERIPDAIWMGTSDGRIEFATPNIAAILGYTPEELRGHSPEERLARVHPDDRRVVSEAVTAFRQTGAPFDLECRVLRPEGRYTWVRCRTMARYEQDGVTRIEGVVSDIHDRKLLEESLHQAQKMEAIGQLTGGIAHDFNNLLAVILGSSDLLVESLEGDERRFDASEIRDAAERAAALTQQLLAFSRRQVLEPSVVDLNRTLDGVRRMLCRVIGEDVTVTVISDPRLGRVRVDAGQLEQVLMNLAVNARDAMPTGGRLTLETANADLAAECRGDEGCVPPGRYVVLSVSDTGCGMDAATRRRIFEPFFTTKEVGKGTGLGLSTCYGIVKQSGGHIVVYSEAGRGSSFKLYLPRIEGDGAEPAAATVRATRLDGTETVLVVEDDERVRVTVSRILTRRGYRVLLARDCDEAKSLARSHTGRIDLLLSDVVMPSLNGPDLAKELKALLGCKVLLMSGYTDHAALREGELGTFAGFIRKPFTPDQLCRRARDLLDA